MKWKTLSPPKQHLNRIDWRLLLSTSCTSAFESPANDSVNVFESRLPFASRMNQSSISKSLVLFFIFCARVPASYRRRGNQACGVEGSRYHLGSNRKYDSPHRCGSLCLCNLREMRRDGRRCLFVVQMRLCVCLKFLKEYGPSLCVLWLHVAPCASTLKVN